LYLYAEFYIASMNHGSKRDRE